MKRILSLILIAAFLCGIPGCAGGREPVSKSVHHTERAFSELTGSGTDASLEIARARELLFRIERGEISGEHAQSLLDARTEAYVQLETDAAIAYVRYCQDVTNVSNKEAYDALSVQIEELSCILVDIALLLKDDPALKDRYDAETVEALERRDALSDLAVMPLIERERTLVGAYEMLSEQLTIEFKDRTWTGDMILSDPSLPAEDFAALYEAYLDRFNAKAGTIYLELIQVRREIADRLGYSSYTDYRYACLGRAYTPEDAASFSARVRTELVPLFSELQRDFYRSAWRLYGAAFEQRPTIQWVGEAVSSILPELNEPWNYMIEHGMYDLGTDTKRMPGSFTTYFGTYGAPFLFGAWTGGFDSIPTLIHEFGHYAEFYLNGDAAGGPDALDLAEIDAQGLELMSVLQYDTLYGDLSDAAETAELFYALYALVDGCVEDAFQQYAYAQTDPTLDALNAEYSRLCGEYGLDALGTDGRSWTQIQHTFQAPFYYISYATSMCAALELYLIEKENANTAEKAYRTILMRREGAQLWETLTDAGLHDPFDPGGLTALAHGLNRIRHDGGTSGSYDAESDG